MHNFSYNGMLSEDYSAYVFGGGTYSTPEKNIESVEVAGRNGAIRFDYGNWHNVNIDYQVIIMKNFTENFLRMKADFMSLNSGRYYRLEDTFHPEFYRLGVLRSITKPKMSNDYDSGVFTVSFECKPQMFFQFESPVAVSTTGSILNNTGYDAFPLIEITGSSGSFQIGSNTVTVASHTGKILYDTEINEAYGTAGENMNQYISLASGVPVLHQGSNGITATDVTLLITPRMYQI